MGVWPVLASLNPRVRGRRYHHDGNTLKGSKSVTFNPGLPRHGTYRVYMAFLAGSTQSQTTPVTMTTTTGNATVRVNQRAGVMGAVPGYYLLPSTYTFGVGGAAVWWWGMVARLGMCTGMCWWMRSRGSACEWWCVSGCV